MKQPEAQSSGLNLPPRDRAAVALDRAERALRRARDVIAAAICAAAPDADPAEHPAIVEIDKALADIATLREGGK